MFKIKKDIHLIYFLYFIFILNIKLVSSLEISLNYPLNNSILNPYQKDITLNVTLLLNQSEYGHVIFINQTNDEILCQNYSIENNTKVYCLVSLNNSESLYWIVNISDEIYNLTFGIYNFSISSNNLPNINFNYYPTNPNASTNITFNITAIDDYNDSLIIEYFFYNQTNYLQNDLIFSGNLTALNNTNTFINLSNQYFKKHDKINFTFRIFDTEYTDFNSTLIIINDSLSKYYSFINSTEQYANTKNKYRNDSILIGYCSVFDYDNDNYTITANFYKNNELYKKEIPYKIDIGNEFTCLLDYCWGKNDYGQLGDNSTQNKKIPSKINFSQRFIDISAGLTHTCGILNNGSVYCFGSNYYGQLGTGLYYKDLKNSTKPLAINFSKKFLKISNGYYHTCGIIENGSAYCFGRNQEGQLGTGTTFNNISFPIAVNSSYLFKDLSAGAFFTCGILVNGSLYCWGSGFYGNLGNGENTDKLNPYPINSSLKFISISSGYDHSCAIANNLSLLCWGNNNNGELGTGDNINYSNPVFITNYTFISISLGRDYTCGILTNNTAYCWGKNQYGNLGYDEILETNLPLPFNYSYLNKSEFHYIKAGHSHTCGILINKSVVCFGSGSYGQLGNNLELNTSYPVFVDYSFDFYEKDNIINLSYNINFGDNYKLECNYYNQTNYLSSLNSTIINIGLPKLEITLITPLNRSVINQSFKIPFNFLTNETSKCKYSINDGSYINLNNYQYSTNFSTNFSIFSNQNHSIKINCTEFYGTSKLFAINITINDTTAPTITINQESATTNSINISFSFNEPSNWTFTLINVTNQTNSNFLNSSYVYITDLDDDTTYYYNLTACDQLRNCRSILNSKRTLLDDSNGQESEESSNSGSSTYSSTNVTNKVSQQWSNPQEGQYIMNIASSEIAITQIIFDLENNLSSNLIISVEKLSELPSNILNTFPVSYQHIKIEKTNSNISNIKIKFRILNNWIIPNNISVESILLMSYNTTKNSWLNLSTKKTTNDTNYNYFESDFLHLNNVNYFSIVGEKILTTNSFNQIQNNQEQEIQISEETNSKDEATSNNNQENQNLQQQTNQQNTKQNENTNAEKPKQISNFNIFSFLIIFIIFIIAGSLTGFILYQRSLSITSDKELSELTNYIKKCREEGIETESIKNALLKVGWDEKIIDLALFEVHIPNKEIEKLRSYILEMRKKIKEEEIKNNLLKVGWSEEYINEAFKKL